jgi:hypothetical protein
VWTRRLVSIVTRDTRASFVDVISAYKHESPEIPDSLPLLVRSNTPE